MQYTTTGGEKNRNLVTVLEKLVTKVTNSLPIGPLCRAGTEIMVFIDCNAADKKELQILILVVNWSKDIEM